MCLLKQPGALLLSQNPKHCEGLLRIWIYHGSKMGDMVMCVVQVVLNWTLLRQSALQPQKYHEPTLPLPRCLENVPAWPAELRSTNETESVWTSAPHLRKMQSPQMQASPLRCSHLVYVVVSVIMLCWASRVSPAIRRNKHIHRFSELLFCSVSISVWKQARHQAALGLPHLIILVSSALGKVQANLALQIDSLSRATVSHSSILASSLRSVRANHFKAKELDQTSVVITAITRQYFLRQVTFDDSLCVCDHDGDDCDDDEDVQSRQHHWLTQRPHSDRISLKPLPPVNPLQDSKQALEKEKAVICFFDCSEVGERELPLSGTGAGFIKGGNFDPI